jgi:hypothetical protein
MQTFYITFGQKYRFEPHPQGGHPDGYFTVQAKNEDKARHLVYNTLGVAWAGIYSSLEDLGPEYYPKGCIGTVEQVNKITIC